MKKVNSITSAAIGSLLVACLVSTSAQAFALTPNPFAFDDEAASSVMFNVGPGAGIDCGWGPVGNTSNSTTTGFAFRPRFEDCNLSLIGGSYAVEVTANSDWNVTYGEGDADGWPGLEGDLEVAAVAGGAPALQLTMVGGLCSIDIDSYSGSVTLRNVGVLSTTSLVASFDGNEAEIADQVGFCPGLYRAPAYGLAIGGELSFSGVSLSD
jgi:hypothetical protein